MLIQGQDGYQVCLTFHGDCYACSQLKPITPLCLTRDKPVVFSNHWLELHMSDSDII